MYMTPPFNPKKARNCEENGDYVNEIIFNLSPLSLRFSSQRET
jgi:hypothetical protein